MQGHWKRWERLQIQGHRDSDNRKYSILFSFSFVAFLFCKMNERIRTESNRNSQVFTETRGCYKKFIRVSRVSGDTRLQYSVWNKVYTLYPSIWPSQLYHSILYLPSLTSDSDTLWEHSWCLLKGIGNILAGKLFSYASWNLQLSRQNERPREIHQVILPYALSFINKDF